MVLPELESEIVTFPCCRNKEQKLRLFCCVSCHAIVHKSCWARKKQWTHLGQHKIYCSQLCLEEATSKEVSMDILKQLKSENDKLRRNLDLKEKHCEDVKRTKAAFEDDVFDMEAYYKKELETQACLIKELTTKVHALQRDQSIHTEQRSSESIAIQTTPLFSKNQDTQTKETVPNQTQTQSIQEDRLLPHSTTTREVQTMTDKRNVGVLTRVHDDVLNEALLVYNMTRIQIGRSTQTDFDLPTEDTPVSQPAVVGKSKSGNKTFNASSQKKKRPQLVIIGDRMIRGFSGLIKSCTKGHFDINAQSRSKTCCSDIVEMCATLGERLDRDDVLIVFMGPGDCIRGNTVTDDTLQKIVTHSRNTNVMVVGAASMHPRRIVLNKLIAEQNASIRRLVDKTENAHFLSLKSLNYSDLNSLLAFEKKMDLAKYMWETFIMKRINSDPVLTHQGQNEAITGRMPEASTGAIEPNGAEAADGSQHNFFSRTRCYTTRD